MNRFFGWLIIIGIMIVAMWMVISVAMILAETQEKCKDICESQQMDYFDFKPLNKLCRCLDQDNKIEEFGIK